MSRSSSRKPELLAPAGDWSSLEASLDSGADAVYFGVKALNMRAAAKNFELTELPKLLSKVRERSARAYLTLNTTIYNSEIPQVRRILSKAARAGVDGVICWDPAVISEAQRLNLNCHISTQASISNFEAVKHYAGKGAVRVNMARECSLEDIKDVKKAVDREDINCEIEVFAHGAMCLSVSGRCFLSLYSFGTSANRGECYQPCRRLFRIESVDGDVEYLAGNDYILSPKDLCTLPFLDRLISAGVSALKIEGRARSADYVKTVVGCYREAIDAVFEGRYDDMLKKELLSRVKEVFNRGLSGGFYLGTPSDKSGGLEHTRRKVYTGSVDKFYKKIKVAEISVRERGLYIGDTLLVARSKSSPEIYTVEQMQIDGSFVDFAAKGERVGVKMPFICRPGDKIFVLEEND